MSCRNVNTSQSWFRARLLTFAALWLTTSHAHSQHEQRATPEPTRVLLLSAGGGRLDDDVVQELQQIDLTQLKEAADPSAGTEASHAARVRFPISAALAHNSRDEDANNFSSFIPINYYFDKEVNLASISHLDIDPLVGFELTHDLSLGIGGSLFWRDTTDDGASASTANLPAGANDTGLLATELSIGLEWKISRNLTVMAGYSHFFAGSFLDATGLGKDLDFVGLRAVFRF